MSVLAISLKNPRIKVGLSIAEFKDIFNVPRSLLAANQNKRLEIYKDLMQILNFRNRVFHYEKVNNHIQYKNIGKLLDKIGSMIDDDARTISNALELLENRLFLNILKKLKQVDKLILANPKWTIEKSCNQVKVAVSVYKFYKENL